MTLLDTDTDLLKMSRISPDELVSVNGLPLTLKLVPAVNLVVVVAQGWTTFKSSHITSLYPVPESFRVSS